MRNQSEVESEELRQERERQFLELRRAVEEVDETEAVQQGKIKILNRAFRGQKAVGNHLDIEDPTTALVEHFLDVRSWADAVGVNLDRALQLSKEYYAEEAVTVTLDERDWHRCSHGQRLDPHKRTRRR